MQVQELTGPTFDQVAVAVREVLPGRRRGIELKPDMHLADDLGLTSLEAAEVFVRLEELCGRRLDPDAAEDVRTVGDLMRLRPLAAA